MIKYTDLERQVLYNALSAEIEALMQIVIEDGLEAGYLKEYKAQLRVAKRLRDAISEGGRKNE